MGGTFKIGDTVRLKSGGALMTVQSIRGENNDFAECVWHEGKKAYSEIYNMAVLEHSTNAIGTVRLSRS